MIAVQQGSGPGSEIVSYIDKGAEKVQMHERNSSESWWIKAFFLNMQVFERANMLVMLYRTQEGTVACTVPVHPLRKLVERPARREHDAACCDGDGSKLLQDGPFH
jgi:hypothetical protein